MGGNHQEEEEVFGGVVVVGLGVGFVLWKGVFILQALRQKNYCPHDCIRLSFSISIISFASIFLLN